MSFQESVIIPLAMFKQCQFSKHNANSPETLLLDTNLPSDLKMKLVNQQKYLKLDDKNPSPAKSAMSGILPSSAASAKTSDISHILSNMTTSDVPYAKSILEKILENETVIGWNDKYEVVLDGEPIVLSNIADILQYLLRKKIITRDSDVPVGTEETYKKLLEINVPQSWLKARPPRRTDRNIRPPRRLIEQSGSGIRWAIL